MIVQPPCQAKTSRKALVTIADHDTAVIPNAKTSGFRYDLVVTGAENKGFFYDFGVIGRTMRPSKQSTRSPMTTLCLRGSLCSSASHRVTEVVSTLTINLHCCPFCNSIAFACLLQLASVKLSKRFDILSKCQEHVRRRCWSTVPIPLRKPSHKPAHTASNHTPGHMPTPAKGGVLRQFAICELEFTLTLGTVVDVGHLKSSSA